MDAQVTVYTKPTCPHCRMVKEYLDQHGVPYRERDVSTDGEARQDLDRINAPGVPVTVINGLAVVGFDKIRLDDELKAHGVAIAKDP